MYGRQSNFRRLDLESIFFAFYYQKGTYAQYLAASELKRRGWVFNTRFLTWMRKDGDKKSRRTLYFDYENDWRMKTSTSQDF